MSSLLDVDDLHAFYGASHVVQGVSFSIAQGEAVALVGRNGVGKTSTLKSLMGMETRTRGTVRFALGAAFLRAVRFAVLRSSLLSDFVFAIEFQSG